MNFPKNFADLIPYIVFVAALEIFYWYTLQRHYMEIKRLRDEKAALLEILLSFLRHETGIQQQKKARSKNGQKKD